jgi:hypothetical protein
LPGQARQAQQEWLELHGEDFFAEFETDPLRAAAQGA